MHHHVTTAVYSNHILNVLVLTQSCCGIGRHSHLPHTLNKVLGLANDGRKLKLSVSVGVVIYPKRGRR